VRFSPEAEKEAQVEMDHSLAERKTLVPQPVEA
jgi:hypothetical protein